MMNFAHPEALRRLRAGHSRTPPASPSRLLGNVSPGALHCGSTYRVKPQYPTPEGSNECGPSTRTVNQPDSFVDQDQYREISHHRIPAHPMAL